MLSIPILFPTEVTHKDFIQKPLSLIFLSPLPVRFDCLRNVNSNEIAQFIPIQNLIKPRIPYALAEFHN